eukprot:TRINITY_DN27767_c0_g1_i1.p1 TRINITY_DN27767_c0_g1~~TRINITY_DN27767_c0_g1_i1.p1  ORF type:complete len:305 (+),score=69.86 TRINITY_DN27767_c0_g1_i1:149-1063(+)
MVLRIVTYNVHRFTAADGSCTLDAVAAALVRLRPDVVGLNEVDIRKRPGVLEQLASRLGPPDFHVAFYGHVRGVFGNAVLSRWPTVRQRHTPLRGGTELHLKPGTRKLNGDTVGPAGETHRISRGLLECEIAVPVPPAHPQGGGSVALTVACTHLDHINEDQRLGQLRHIAECAPLAGCTVLLGDLNALQRADYSEAEWDALESRARNRGWAPPRHGCLRTLEEAGMVDCFAAARGGAGEVSRVSPPERMTAHVGEPLYRIDYCWAGRELLSRFSLAGARVATECSGSDHYPLVTDLTLPTPHL